MGFTIEKQIYWTKLHSDGQRVVMCKFFNTWRCTKYNKEIRNNPRLLHDSFHRNQPSMMLSMETARTIRMSSVIIFSVVCDQDNIVVVFSPSVSQVRQLMEMMFPRKKDPRWLCGLCEMLHYAPSSRLFQHCKKRQQFVTIGLVFEIAGLANWPACSAATKLDSSIMTIERGHSKLSYRYITWNSLMSQEWLDKEFWRWRRNVSAFGRWCEVWEPLHYFDQSVFDTYIMSFQPSFMSLTHLPSTFCSTVNCLLL
jgi:hypothetical protein